MSPEKYTEDTIRNTVPSLAGWLRAELAGTFAPGPPDAASPQPPTPEWYLVVKTEKGKMVIPGE